MTVRTSADAGCLVVGEYIDEGEVPESLAHLKNKTMANSEVERPRVVANCIDLWNNDDSEKEFKVLLRDQRIVTVRGHALRFVPSPSSTNDSGSYGVVVRNGDSESFVALFNAVSVTGVFCGDISAIPNGTCENMR